MGNYIYAASGTRLSRDIAYYGFPPDAIAFDTEVPSCLFNAAGNFILMVDCRCVGLLHEQQECGCGFAEACTRADLVALITCRNETLHLEFFNKDGSSENFCGNAMRCLYDTVGNSLNSDSIGVEAITRFCRARSFSDMHGNLGVGIPAQSIVCKQINASQFFVDIGTPHFVQQSEFFESPDAVRAVVPAWSPSSNMNVTILGRVNQSEIEVRTFERGVGETGSCGTGALSAFVVAQLLTGQEIAPRQRTSKIVRFVSSGEQLTVTYDPELREYQVVGPCQLISQGYLNLGDLLCRDANTFKLPQRLKQFK